MYPSTEKQLIKALRFALASFDSGEPGADVRLATLARALIAVADSDDAEKVQLQVNAAMRADAVPQLWLSGFLQVCKIDGMPEQDVRASAIGLWHDGDSAWQEARLANTLLLGEQDGIEHAAVVNSFIKNRDRLRALDAV